MKDYSHCGGPFDGRLEPSGNGFEQFYAGERLICFSEMARLADAPFRDLRALVAEGNLKASKAEAVKSWPYGQ